MNWNRAYYSTIAVFTTLLLTTSLAVANPTPIGSPGSTLAPFALKPIRGVSIAEETLIIEDGKTGTIPSFIAGGGTMNVPCVRYQAQYQFQNKTGKPTTVKVGFPVIVYSFKAGGSYGGLTGLEAVYGDKKLDVKESSESKPMIFPRSELNKIINELDSARVVRKVAESPDFVDLGKLGGSLKTAKEALIKSKALNGKQIARCLAEFKQVVYVSTESDLAVTQQCLIWYTFEIPLPQGLSEKLTVSYTSFAPIDEDYAFSYILSTARFWNNQMNRLKVEIEPDREFLKKGGTYKILPRGKFLPNKSGRYVFQSENTAPNFDIHVKRVSAR